MNWINRFADRIGNVTLRVLCAVSLICTIVFSASAACVAQSAPATTVTAVTVSYEGSDAVVDVRVQGAAQYEWHRLRDPDNRFWLDIPNAQLATPALDNVEPAPLGGVRLRQIDATTVRVAISLTAPKQLDVISTSNGVRIIVHPRIAGADITRSGTGVLGATGTTPQTAQAVVAQSPVMQSNGGPSAAQIDAIERGKSPAAAVPAPTMMPAMTEATNNGTQPVDPIATPAPAGQTDATQGPTAAQIATMTGEAAPTPNPLLSASPATWKFAPRATYNATNPRLIVIDPGHGGSDRGASRNGVQEATLTLDMANRLRDILTSRGWQVVMTRATDVDVYKPNDSAHDELQARVDVGNTAGARLFVSIHANSFINATPYGTTTYYSKQTDVPLATAVQNQLANMLGTKDDGIVKSHLYVTLHSNMPAVLVETAFLSNPNDFAKLTSSDWRQKVAEAIANGIADYAGSPPK